MRPPARAAGRRDPRRGLRAPGRRLRRDVRRRDRRRGPRQAPDHPADGRRAHLRRERPDRQDRQAGRPVRQAEVPADGEQGRRRAACLPGRRGQRLRLHPGSAGARPGPDAACLSLRRRHAEPVPRVHDRRIRRPAPGTRLEPGLRPAEPVWPALRAAGRRDRPGAVVHAGLRRGSRRAADRGVLLQPRGPAAAVRAGAHPHRLAHRPAVRPVGALPLDRRADQGARRRARRVRGRHPQPDRHQDRPAGDPRRRAGPDPPSSARTASPAG